MKKITSIALVMIMILATLSVGLFSASAATTQLSGDTLTYTGTGTASKEGHSSEDIAAIKNVVFENGVTSLGSRVLEGLNRLTTVQIGSGVTSISADAFGTGTTTTQVEKFVVSDSNSTYMTIADGTILITKDGRQIIHAAYGASVPTSAIAPNVISINSYAFENTNLSGTVTLPDNVKVIGSRAFANNSISSIEKFGIQFNTLGSEAFADNPSLTTIGSIENPKLLVGSNAFYNDPVRVNSFNGDESEWNTMTASDSTLRSAAHNIVTSQTEWVVFDSITNGGTLATNPSNLPWTGSDSGDFTINVTNPTSSSGKNFLGWSENSASTSPEYTSSNNVIKSNGTVRSVRLYAIFGSAATDVWTITFDANGGVLPDALKSGATVERGKSTTIPSSVPTNTKYDFLGWSTSSSATKAEYKPGDSYKPSANSVLYAVWNTEGPFTVKFEGNGNDTDPVKNVPAAETVTKNSSISVANPSRYYAKNESISRHTFLGWDESADAKSPKYKAGDTQTSITKVTYNMTLYAIWSNDGPFEVRFFSDWGWVGTEYWGFSEESPYYMASESYTIDKGNELNPGQVIEIPDYPIESGKTCDCWLSDKGRVSYKPGDLVEINRDLVIYPNWNASHSDAGSVSKSAQLNLLNQYKETDIKVTVGYNSKVKITAAVKGIPTGSGAYLLAIYEGRNQVQVMPVFTGEQLIEYTSPEPLKNDTNYTVKLCDSLGNPLVGVMTNNKDKTVNVPLIAKITVKVRRNFFSRLLGFFRVLLNRIPVQNIGEPFYYGY